MASVPVIQQLVEKRSFLTSCVRYRAAGNKPLKMGDFRNPRCRTGCPNVVQRRDARERRSKVEVDKATDGFFNRLLYLSVLVSVAQPATDYCVSGCRVFTLNDLGARLHFRHQLGVANEIGDAIVGQPCLPGAEQLARTP